MATTFNYLPAGAHSNLGQNLNRQKYAPLDGSSVFTSIKDLEYYIKKGAFDQQMIAEEPSKTGVSDYVANIMTQYPYVGQIVTIVADSTVKTYKITDVAACKYEQIDAAIAPGDLPIASATTLGAIKVGEGLGIATDGTLSAQKLTVDQKVEGNETSENPASTKAVYDWSLSTLATAATTAQGKVNALETSLTGSYLPTNYLSVGVANSPSETDMLMKRTEVEAKINALDTAISTLTTAETIKSIKETDGIIAIEKQSIQIDQSQVNNLTGDLATINTKITGLQTISSDHETRLTAAEGDIDVLEGKVGYIASISGDLSGRIYATEQHLIGTDATLNAVSSDYLKASTFKQLSNDIGLSASIAESSPVATQKYVTTAVADLAGAMHFRGVTTSELKTGDQVIPEGVSYYDASATPPKVPKAGDMVINATTAKEFVWVGEDWNADPTKTNGHWVELGDEKIYLTKAEFATLSTNWLTGTFDPFKSAVELSVGALSSYAKAVRDDLTTETADRKSNDEYLSSQISAIAKGYALSADVTAISGSLFNKIAAEESARSSNDTFLSGKIDNKVKLGFASFAEGAEDPTYSIASSDLSVVKIGDDDYYRLVGAGKQDDNIIYIVSSDYVNGHDQRVINVGAPISATDAVNLSTMQTADKALDNKISSILTAYLSAIQLNGIAFDYTRESALASLSIDIISCGTAS